MESEELLHALDALRHCVGDLKTREGTPGAHPGPPGTALPRELEALGRASDELWRLNQDAQHRRRELEAECQRYRDFFELAPEAYFITSHDGLIQDANRAAGELLDTPACDLVGRTLSEFVDRGSADALSEALVRLGQTDRIADWTVRLRPHGREAIDVSLTATAARDEGGRVVARWIARDVSRRVRAEEEVRRLNVVLEQRVAQRTAELEAANRAKDAVLAQEAALREQAEAANRAKDQFLAMLSHELRTPLTPVLAAVTVLANERRIPDDVRAILATVRRNVELEARLIDDLLDLTHLERGTLELEVDAVDVHASIEDVVEICRSEARLRQLDLAVALEARDCVVRGDSGRLQQVWWSLLKNAIQFTPPLGEITVRTHNDEAGRLVVEVHDTGVGIEPAAIERLFGAFQQGGGGASRHVGGLGLGLAISRALVTAHGGSIRAASEGRGRGATFTVRLPTAREPAPRSATTRDAIKANRGLRILLVEDHDDTARLMGRLLQGAGHRVQTASSVELALHLSQTEPFDLIISDLGLPDGTGLDLLRRIRGQRAIRAIALSGFGMDEDVRRCREAGFDAHLTKPVNFQRLLAMIRQVAG